jgi:hypothetical protein
MRIITSDEKSYGIYAVMAEREKRRGKKGGWWVA